MSQTSTHYSRLHPTRHAELRQHRSHVGKQIVKEPNKAETWAKVTKNNGWLNISSGSSYKVTPKGKSHFKDLPKIDYGVTPNPRCTSWPCIQRTRLSLSFIGNVRRILDTVRAILEIGNIRNREQPRIDWQCQRARVIDARLASDSRTGSCGEAGSPHTIMLPSWMVTKVKLTSSTSSSRASLQS